MAKATRRDNKVVCTFCKKAVIHNPKSLETENHIGDGGALGQRIMEAKYSPGKIASDHPLSYPSKPGKYSRAQAHHLICSETMNNNAWKRICSNFGYNINCVENGIFLPSSMPIACQLKIPLHRGNHSITETNEGTTYVKSVKNKIKPIKDSALKNDYCDDKADIIAELNQISKDIWDNVKSFAWTLTSDGHDYHAGLIDAGKAGCAGHKSLSKKRTQKPKKSCPVKRNHGISIRRSTFFKEQK